MSNNFDSIIGGHYNESANDQLASVLSESFTIDGRLGTLAQWADRLGMVYHSDNEGNLVSIEASGVDKDGNIVLSQDVESVCRAIMYAQRLAAVLNK